MWSPLLLGLTLLVPGSSEASDTVRRTVFVMGTTLEVAVEARNPSAAGWGAEAVIREVERMEALLSTWTPDSELTRLNALPPGEAWAGDAETLSLIRESLEWAARTGEAFHPGIGALVDAWDLRGTGRVPTTEEIAAALARSGPRGFALDAGGVIRSRGVGAWIDAGGFGKGAALRSAADSATALGAGGLALNLGGQIYWSPFPGDPELVLGIAHPERRTEVAHTLHLRVPPGASGISIATSGFSERGFRANGRWYSHVLDPRTGFPVDPWGSVTVVAEDPVMADVLATAILVMGPEAGPAFAETIPDAGILILELRDGRVRAHRSSGLATFLAASSSDSIQPTRSSPRGR